MMAMHEQIRRMRALYPAFEVVFNGGWHVEWRGPIRPFARTYTVRVVMVHPVRIDELRVKRTFGANVTLITPSLELGSPKAPGVPTPHVYWNKDDLLGSRLCLFDPATNQWKSDMPITETVIPWTIDWIANYEGWLATGEWTGGGRDHGTGPK